MKELNDLKNKSILKALKSLKIYADKKEKGFDGEDEEEMEAMSDSEIPDLERKDSESSLEEKGADDEGEFFAEKEEGEEESLSPEEIKELLKEKNTFKPRHEEGMIAISISKMPSKKMKSKRG